MQHVMLDRYFKLCQNSQYHLHNQVPELLASYNKDESLTMKRGNKNEKIRQKIFFVDFLDSRDADDHSQKRQPLIHHCA